MRWRNDFRLYLFGKMRDEDGGTAIRCRFGLHPLVMPGWAIIFLVFGINWWFFIPMLTLALSFLSIGAAISFMGRESLLEKVANALNARLSNPTELQSRIFR